MVRLDQSQKEYLTMGNVTVYSKQPFGEYEKFIEIENCFDLSIDKSSLRYGYLIRDELGQLRVIKETISLKTLKASKLGISIEWGLL